MSVIRNDKLIREGKVHFGRQVIGFSVVRSGRRRKTIALYIEPSGDVLVRAPVKTPDSRLNDIVKSKADWIIKKRQYLNEVFPLTKREFVSGESLYYLGRHLRLKVLRDVEAQEPVVKMIGGRLEVMVNRSGKNGRYPEEIRDVISQWYKLRAEERIPERVKHYARKMHLPEMKVYIRDQKRIWGSCSVKGVLRFNWRIMMAPMSLIDYVVVHELCHLKYRNHSKSFWKHLCMIIPDYEIRKEKFRREGRAYQL